MILGDKGKDFAWKQRGMNLEICHFILKWQISRFLSYAKLSVSSMIKGVLGQPNFSPQTNTTQLSPKLTQTLTTYHPLKLTQTYRVVLSWTNGTSLNFLGKRNRKFEFFVLCLFGEKSWVVPEPLLSYYCGYVIMFLLCRYSDIKHQY